MSIPVRAEVAKEQMNVPRRIATGPVFSCERLLQVCCGTKQYLLRNLRRMLPCSNPGRMKRFQVRRARRIVFSDTTTPRAVKVSCSAPMPRYHVHRLTRDAWQPYRALIADSGLLLAAGLAPSTATRRSDATAHSVAQLTPSRRMPYPIGAFWQILCFRLRSNVDPKT